MKNLSVVVITRNRIEKLRHCLDSIIKILPEAEIIVIDNNSNDGTKEYIEGLAYVKHHFAEKNFGWSIARNIGISMCTRDYIMFLDDDAWIQELNILCIENYFISHKEVGVIAPRIFYPSGLIQESIRSFPTIKALLWRGIGLYRIFPNVSWYRKYAKLNHLTIHEVDWAIGACQIIRKDVFDNVGLLDEKLFYYEDADFCRRAKRAGYTTVYWPDATIYHEYARTSSRVFSVAFIRHLKSIIRFYKSTG